MTIRCRRCGKNFADAHDGCPLGGEHLPVDRRQDPRKAMTIDAAALRERVVGGLYDQQVDVGKLCARHRRSIDEAVALIDDALARAYQPAAPGMGAMAWLACDDVCPASASVVRQMAATLQRRLAAAEALVRARESDDTISAAHGAHGDWCAVGGYALVDALRHVVDQTDLAAWPGPQDAAALRRCVGAVDAVDAVAYLGELALRSPDWDAFVRALPAIRTQLGADLPNRDGAIWFVYCAERARIAGVVA